MTPTVFPAPAKINLFLHVTGRRADGYHLLQTAFQLVDLADAVAVTVRGDGRLVREGDVAGVPESSDLCLRAAAALKAATGCPLGCTIGLRKRIPIGAGLGGGSSDAATVLHALNVLWDTRLPTPELARIGLSLGADVPLFVNGHSAFAEGIGEALVPMALGAAWYVLLFPGIMVPTAAIFGDEHLTRNTPGITIPSLIQGAPTHNDLEVVATRLYPGIGAALDWLRPFGDARMSGSGSSVFVRVESRVAGEAIVARVPEGWRAWCVRGIDRSPLLDVLDALRSG